MKKNSRKSRSKKKNNTRTPLKNFFILLVVFGVLAAGGVGGYVAYKNYKERQVTVTPVPDSVTEKKIVKMEINESDTIRTVSEKISKTFPHLHLTQEQVVAKLNDRSYLRTLQKSYGFIPNSALAESITYPLEGLLSPLTYEYYEDDTLDSIIRKPLDSMSLTYTKYAPLLQSKNISFYDGLILASITNAEVPSTQLADMKMVAQVFQNRLTSGIGLGSDVTLSYILEKRELSQSDFEKNQNNPYNTRSNTSLTPTPVQFVTDNALNAIINPTPNDYTYFLTGTCAGRADYGKFFYAKTYDEHKQNITDHMTCEE